MNWTHPPSSRGFKRIRGVQFGILSPQVIRAQSVCRIETGNVYLDGVPVRGGLADPRMGCLTTTSICETCGMSCVNCPGHFGHLDLVEPMFHGCFLKTLVKVLRCVCYHCSSLMLDPTDLSSKRALSVKDPKSRLHAVSIICARMKSCSTGGLNGLKNEETGGCSNEQCSYSLEGCSVVVNARSLDDDSKTNGKSLNQKRILTARECHSILSRISQNDMVAMGFTIGLSEPSWMILTVLPIPPLSVRPSVLYGGNERAEDDISSKLQDIVRVDQLLRSKIDIGAGSYLINEMTSLLQWHVYTLHDNSMAGLPEAQTKSKKPIRSLCSRIKGKEGRIRGNLMGKRVDFSARTVITGDPNLDIDQVGVPKSIAMTLTFTEKVTPYNLHQMINYVTKGPSQWPGAKRITREDGSSIDLRFAKGDLNSQLRYGYSVERHMIDDDLVIFNRQPSLHKMSMMGHRVKILPYSTFRLNLSVTSPYNADFDGDEMNLHLAQGQESRAEIRHLMCVPKQCVSPQGNRPVMGIVQDSLLATSRLTRRDTFVDRNMFMQLFMWLLRDTPGDIPVPMPCIVHPTPLWTGKQMFSLLLPKINMRKESGNANNNKSDESDFSRSDCKVFVSNGELLSGVICKKSVGASVGGLIHLTWLEYGPERTKELIGYIQRLSNFWLLHEGFTVSCADIFTNDRTRHSVQQILKQSKEDVCELISQAETGLLETQPGKSLKQSFESRVNQRLNQAREDSGKIAADSLDERNNIIAMVTSGSKGSIINIAQICACVGQQNVEGKRIPFGFVDRTLPHFSKDDLGPESRGFVANSYLSGLSPAEFYFHAMGGREGIIDTACKTAETGYIQRRLIKSMESVRVYYDGSVRSELGDIMQSIYGEDGMAAEWIEDQRITLVSISHANLEKMAKHCYTEPLYGEGWLQGEYIFMMQTDRTAQAICDEEYSRLVSLKQLLCTEVYPTGEDHQHLPVNIIRLVSEAHSLFDEIDDSSSMSPPEVVNAVDGLIGRLSGILSPTQLKQHRSNKTIEKAATLSSKTMRSHGGTKGVFLCESLMVLEAQIRTVLCSKNLLYKEKLGRRAIEWIAEQIERKFYKSLVHPGESVGTIAAQSICEPATQMTLNTFHFAGVGSKNVTLGVPRLKELINVAKTLRTPSMTIFMQPEIANNDNSVKEVQSLLPQVTFGDVTLSSEIIYDPDSSNTMVGEDDDLVSAYYELAADCDLNLNCAPWVLRILLNPHLMLDKKLTTSCIANKITEEYGDDLQLIYSDDNAESLTMRIRIIRDESSTSEELDSEFRLLRKLEQSLMSTLSLKGIHGIKNCFMREDSVNTYIPETGTFSRRTYWVLDTDGVHLKDVFYMHEIDFRRTFSNDLLEILSVLGVEACRKALFNELRNVISFDGSYVNYRHLALLCETMCMSGKMMPITRHGINRHGRGPLMRASFEEMVEMLIDAGVYAEVDEMKGVSENIMLGQLPPIGTAEFGLLLDTEKLAESQPALPEDDALLQKIRVEESRRTELEFSNTGDEFYHGDISSPKYEKIMASVLSPYTTLGGFSPTLGGSLSPVMSMMSPFSPGGISELTPGSNFPGAMTPFSPFSGTAHFSPGRQYSANSPSYSPVSPVYSPTSPAYSPTSPAYSPTSPAYSPASPAYSPASPAYSPASPAYSPTSPAYSPGSPVYSPGSPAYSPTSPAYSPGSPAYSPTSTAYSPASPAYSPTSPAYSPASPAYSPTSPAYSSNNPTYTPSIAAYSPLSPNYSPENSAGGILPTKSVIGKHGYTPASPNYSLESPAYLPTSPMYVPATKGGTTGVYQTNVNSVKPSNEAYSGKRKHQGYE